MIPTKLKECRFIRLHQNKPDKQKHPFGNDWTNNHLSFEEMSKFDDKTYGVMCGQNNLLVIDCDKKELQELLMQNSTLSNTFIVKTAGKGLYHFYFQIEGDFPINPKYPDQPRGFKIDDINGERVGDVQGSGTQVVGPNSELLDGKKYEVVKNQDILKIPYKYLTDLILNSEIGLNMVEKATKIREPINPELIDPQVAAIKAQIKVSDLLPAILKEKYLNSPTGHTGCPFHSSDGGKCLHITDNKTWYCHHCMRGGDVITMQEYLNGDGNFVKAKHDLMKRLGLVDNLKLKVMTILASKDPEVSATAYNILADEFVKLYKVKTVRSDFKPEVWIYDRGIYHPNGKTYIKSFIYDIMGALSTLHFDNRVIDLIMKRTWVEQKDFFRVTYPTKIAVQNGILNTDTKVLEPFNDKYYFFNKLPVSYDPVVGNPEKIINFLNEILPDESDVMLIQEMFGFCLYRDYKWQKAFLLEGSGSNGKSVTCRILEKMLGPDNISNLTLQSLETEKFMLEILHNKLANIDPDLPDKPLEGSNRFKAATGQDALMVDRKFKENLKFTNFAKMIFGCNKVPKTNDTSDGFLRRWAVIRFPFSFVANPTTPNEKKEDIDLISKLTLDSEMNALLNWSVEGLHRLFKNKGFSKNQSTEDIKKFWLRKSSTIHAFFEDEMDKTIEITTTKTEFNNALVEYCVKHGKQIPQLKTIRAELASIGIYIENKMINGFRDYYLVGGGLKNSISKKLNSNEEVLELDR